MDKTVHRHMTISATALLFFALPLARAETLTQTSTPVLGESPIQAIVWTDNQDTAACPRRPTWLVAVQGPLLLFRTRAFDYQAVPIALRGDGSASLDRVIQPGVNIKYRVSGTFNGKGRVTLRLEDLAREGGPCSWRFGAEHQEGILPGVKGGRSKGPEQAPPTRLGP